MKTLEYVFYRNIMPIVAKVQVAAGNSLLLTESVSADRIKCRPTLLALPRSGQSLNRNAISTPRVEPRLVEILEKRAEAAFDDAALSVKLMLPWCII